MPPAPVVRAALRTLGRKPLVIPGPANKVSDFASKTALVTGAGSGIGEAAAKTLAARGAAVVVADVDDDGKRVAREISEEGGTAAYAHADVSSEADTADLVQFAVAAFGGLHLAFSNAGIAQPFSRTHEQDMAARLICSAVAC